MRSRKDELLVQAAETLEALQRAVEAIRSGESESAVCKRLGIKKAFFRRLVFSPETTVFENGDKEPGVGFVNSEEGDENILWSGGERLYAALTGRRGDIPYDAAETAEWCLQHTDLTDRESQAVRMRFFEELTLKEIEDRSSYNTHGETARRWIAGALRKIRRANHEVLSVGSCCYEAVENKRLEKYLARLSELHERNEEIRGMIAEIENREKAASGKDTVETDMRGMSVAEFVQKRVREDGVPLSVRTYNCLIRGLVMSKRGERVEKHLSETKVAELDGMPLSEIGRLRNLGKRSLDELVAFFANEGIYFTDKDGNNVVPDGSGEQEEHERI